MVFYWLNRIITGDTLFGLGIWEACIVAFLLSRLARKWPEWIKAIYAIVLSFALMVLLHYYIDQLQIFWVTPLGPKLDFQK